ncbi:phospholipase [Rhodobacteraceae bacterium RKSG542]|uniref:alpha/beta hydrolase n=1 Tax=Pseudovibrio flavus TaxID=2529854 RepID=UPI0012BC0E1C|nr:phospholipase [Pseudovibrio flavus]MTI18381.1 phospholipase [Pseudovibrio flavus]
MREVGIGSQFGPKNGAARALVVLLHGYGGDARDMEPLARALNKALPQVDVVCLEAPEVCAIWADGKQWFAASAFDAREMWHGVQYAEAGVFQAISRLLNERGLSERELLLCGFSQGAMVALHLALHRYSSLLGCVGLSGALAGGGSLPTANLEKLSILLVHGEDDTVLDASYSLSASSQLIAAGYDVQTEIISGLDHSIDGRVQDILSNFIGKLLEQKREC